MDIIAVAQGVKHAREWAISGKGPLLMEFVTYRYGGHSYVSFSFSRPFYSSPPLQPHFTV